MRNSRGQATIEAVLLGVILVSATIFISTQLRQNGFFATLVKGPWTYLDGMIQYGVWAPEGDARKRMAHANPRRISLEHVSP